MGMFGKRLGMIVACFATIGFACPFDQPDAPKWNPMGKPFYLESGFGDFYHGQINTGIDLSTDGHPGQVVQAPEAGKVISIRRDSSGIELHFLGVSGHKWILSRLSKIHSRAEKPNAFEFKEYDTIAYSSDYLHLELHTPDEKRAINPCEVGIACHDTIVPKILEAATWDAANPKSKILFTSQEQIQKGCIETAPNTRRIRIAFRIQDLATSKDRVAKGIHYATLRQGSDLLFEYKNLDLALPATQLPKEILYSDLGETQGNWLTIDGYPDQLNEIVQRLLREPATLAQKHPLTLEISDQRGNPQVFHFTTRERCANGPSRKETRESLLYTELGAPWINLGLCNSNAKFSLLDSNHMILQRSLCDSVQSVASPVLSILTRWPQARFLTVRLASGESQSISLLPLKGQPVHSMGNHVFLRFAYALPHGENALAWTINDRELRFYPKGLPLKSPADICIPAGKDARVLMQYPGQSRWIPTISKFYPLPDSTPAHCASLPILMDVRGK